MNKTVILGIVCLLIIFGCTTGNVVKDGVVRIGSIQALTGSAASYGTNVQSGIDLALEEINAKGGINGKKLEIIREDGACDATKGVTAAKKLIHIDKIKVILGPSCSPVSMAVAPIAEENKVIMFTSLSSVPDLKYSGDYIFRNRISGGLHGIKIAEFSYNTLNARTASVLHINLDNGIGYRDAFIEKFEELGGEILSVEAYEKDCADFRVQLTKIKIENPDILYVIGQKHEIAIKQVSDLNMKVQIVGTPADENPELLEVAGVAAEGIFYSYSIFNPESSDPLSLRYQQKYFEKYGKISETFAANGYDATMLIANALRLCGEDPNCVRDYLYSTKNYPGVSGLTTFDEYGEVNKPLIIKTIKNGEFVFYSE